MWNEILAFLIFPSIFELESKVFNAKSIVGFWNVRRSLNINYLYCTYIHAMVHVHVYDD